MPSAISQFFPVLSFTDRLEEIDRHFDEIAAAASKLLSGVNASLRISLKLTPLIRHYDDIDGFENFPGVKMQKGREAYVIVTGINTHYLRREPSVQNCPFHD